jgi:eukaryotic-like serine/threonine-protein kinase
MWTWRKIGTAAGVIGLAIIIMLLIVDQLALPWIVSTTDTVRVPLVIGQKVERADYVLRDLGLQVKDIRYQHSTEVPSGVVMSQLPADGSIVKQGRRVYLTVSKGLEAVTMPNLIGISLGEARRTLARSGLQLGTVSSTISAAHEPETIAWQSMAAGTSVAAEASVNVSVSQGASLRMPYLVGLNIDEARSALTDLGLEITTINERPTKAFTAGTIIAQEPPADSSVGASTLVSVTLAR